MLLSDTRKMSKIEDSKIEKTLRKIALEAIKKGEEGATIKVLRKRTESKLGLEDDFLKGGAWRSKSKEIIEAAFADPEQPAEKVKESASKPQKKSKKSDEDGGSSSAGAAKSGVSTPKPPQKTAPQVNGVKRKASGSETASGTGVDSASSTKRASEQSPSKKAKVSAPPAASQPSASQKTASSSGSADSSEEESESESGSSESDEKAAGDSPSPRRPAATEHQQSISAIPSKAFTPPSGYTAVDESLLSNNSGFSEGHLEGKQIWHITAPSNVPISALTELALSSISSGEAVLSHKNVSYALNEDKTMGAESTALLAPSAEGYQKIQPQISRTLHLQQKIDLPNLSARQASQVTESNAAGDVARASVSTVRPQPKGLRMRYKPPGFGKGRPGRIGSGSESGGDEGAVEGGTPSFQFPKTLGQHGVEVRQDGDVEMVDAGEIEGVGEKKAKKKRKEKDDARADGEAPKVNGVSKEPSHGKSVTNGDGAEKESKEEKKRRKEEKRARKEAKSKGTVV